MTQIELIDRLCAVNTLLTDIVREQAEIMAQHGIEAIQTQDEAREDATILTKLENIQNTMIEVKSEMRSYRNEMKEIREYYIRASESLKQLHKRVDRIDKIIDESHPHQYIEE